MISKLNKCFKGVDKTPFFINTYRVLSIIFIFIMDFYSTEEMLTEAETWFNCYTGNFARYFLDRTRENAYKAWVVFCDLALGIHFEDATTEEVDAFINLFMNSSKELNVSIEEVAEGMKEFDEILELIY